MEPSQLLRFYVVQSVSNTEKPPAVIISNDCSCLKRFNKLWTVKTAKKPNDVNPKVDMLQSHFKRVTKLISHFIITDHSPNQSTH